MAGTGYFRFSPLASTGSFVMSDDGAWDTLAGLFLGAGASPRSTLPPRLSARTSAPLACCPYSLSNAAHLAPPLAILRSAVMFSLPSMCVPPFGPPTLELGHLCRPQSQNQARWAHAPWPPLTFHPCAAPSPPSPPLPSSFLSRNVFRAPRMMDMGSTIGLSAMFANGETPDT